MIAEMETSRHGMRKCLRIGEFELFWLGGGRFSLDGGAMFGVVPKVLWSKRYPSDEENLVPLVASPVLVRTPRAVVLIDTGLGNKLDEKQKRIFRLEDDWSLPEDLRTLGLDRQDVDTVVLTHYDFDHAGGVVMAADGGLELTFPRARHILQKAEWEDVLNPNRRSSNTYWPINHELLGESGRLDLVSGDAEVAAGVRVVHTGGHTRGHQAVVIESAAEKALHLGDLLPTHAHLNPLWITAYDNFPLDAVRAKEALLSYGSREGAWFTLYHDPFVRACRLGEDGAAAEEWDDEEGP